jgi:hypothetical protein
MIAPAILIARLVIMGGVLGFVAWLIRRAHVTAEDVVDEDEGTPRGRHLPAINPDFRDTNRRSMAVDFEEERVRYTGPHGA